MRVVLIVVFVALTPGLVRVLGLVVDAICHDLDLFWQIFFGFVAGALLHWALLARLSGYMTLQHEVKHALVALLFLRRIQHFVVTWGRGGLVQHTQGIGGAFGDHTIGLAPYFLLPMTLFIALVAPVADAWQLRPSKLLFGAALAVDLLNIRYDLRTNYRKDLVPLVDGTSAQTDIGRRGYLFTIASIAFYGSALLLFALSLKLWGYAGLPEVARSVARAWLDTGLWLVEQAREISSAIR